MATLTLTLRQPAQLSTSLRSDGVIDTVDHVPGWVVRGALANAWIRSHGRPESAPTRQRFIELFEGGVRFGPLFQGEPPSPLSVFEHKYEPQKAKGCQMAPVDAAEEPALSPLADCAACGQAWKEVRPHHAREATHVRTSVVIDPTTDTAAKGKLFSRRRIPARTRSQGNAAAGEQSLNTTAFTGDVTGPESLVNELLALQGVRIGGRKTSHGSVSLAASETPARMPWLRTDGVLIIPFISPAVFVDDAGRPTTVPSPEELSEVLGVKAQVIRRWVRWDAVGGWHAASGLPKPTEIVVAAGSTYAVKLDGPLSAGSLARLAERGLGLRRHEGFGHIGGRTPVLMTADVAPEAPHPVEVAASQMEKGR